jgi:hypothetical protein
MEKYSSQSTCRRCGRNWYTSGDTPECTVVKDEFDRLEAKRQSKDDQRFLDQAAIEICASMTAELAIGYPRASVALEAWDMADELLKERARRRKG